MSDLITLPRATVQQALEALELGYDSAKAEADQFHATMAGYKPHRHAAMDADVQKIAQAITALRAALEQPEQKPVAWKDRTYGNLHHQDFGNSIPLYTYPPRREWRGLTNLEFVQIELKLRKYHDYDRYDLSLNEFGRAIEAALKERNV